MTGLPPERTEAFWYWFSENDARLFAFEDHQPLVFKELDGKLKELDRNLTFELGPDVDGEREFVISAGGIRESFPSVIALADAAPALERWRITKFRPRRPELGLLRIGDQTIDPRDIDFALEENEGKAGISLFIDGYTDAHADLWGQVGFLFLDMALGEYDVETKVGFINFKPYAYRTDQPRLPIPDLPDYFDDFVREMGEDTAPL